MAEPKFKVAPKKYGGESVVISMRLPKSMLQIIDEAAGATGRTRNEILSMGLEFALDHMELLSGGEADDSRGR